MTASDILIYTFSHRKIYIIIPKPKLLFKHFKRMKENLSSNLKAERMGTSYKWQVQRKPILPSGSNPENPFHLSGVYSWEHFQAGHEQKNILELIPTGCSFPVTSNCLMRRGKATSKAAPTMQFTSLSHTAIYHAMFWGKVFDHL